jgi:hypothetical protein
MVRKQLNDPEHALIWDKLEELGKQPTKIILYILPLFLTLIGGIFTFGYSIDEKLGAHLEAGGKLGAQLKATQVSIDNDLQDKYHRHLRKHDQLEHRLDKIEIHDERLENIIRGIGWLESGKEPDEPSIFPREEPDKPFIFPYDPDSKIPAIFKTENIDP